MLKLFNYGYTFVKDKYVPTPAHSHSTPHHSILLLTHTTTSREATRQNHTPPLHAKPPHKITHHHTKSHTTTQNHIPPHKITHHHTKSHTTTQNHTPPHKITHHHTKSHTTTQNHIPPHKITHHHDIQNHSPPKTPHYNTTT